MRVLVVAVIVATVMVVFVSAKIQAPKVAVRQKWRECFVSILLG